MARRLRSSEWFEGDDEVAVGHRVAMRSAGFEVGKDSIRPIIGIADSSSDLNPCNLPLRALVDDVREGVLAAGGIPVAFPVMSLGEDLMKPAAMLYRNQLSMEVEEYLRAYPLDGVVLLANCDKSIPGALLGALSANLPVLLLTAGPRPVSVFRGSRVGTGTDLWKAWEQHRSGEMNDEAWQEFEECLSCGRGSCNTMGTASSMALVVETLGLSLPGSSVIEAADPARHVVARETGLRIVAAVANGVTPSAVVTAGSFRNAIRVLHAVGGSTNVVIHLLALAGRLGIPIELSDFGLLGKHVPVLADVQPGGQMLIQEFQAVGGLPRLIGELGDLIEGQEVCGDGRLWSDAATVTPELSATTPIRGIATPLRLGGAIATLSGSLAPNGAVIKVSAASPALLRHSGPALVFRSYVDMRSRIDDPELAVTPDSVLVLTGGGPVGVPGMPEWGMIPIPAKLATQGVSDMVRISDSRMSGTSFGTCVLHVSPEAAVGGPLALVRDGDMITLDVTKGRIDLDVGPAELERRRAEWTPPDSSHLRGWPHLYQRHVMQADKGCDLDFLVPTDAMALQFVPPIVGRS